VSLLGSIVGDYKIQRRIGAGGMGVVYQGIHIRLEQPVAIKDLSPELAGNQEMRQRFMREAKIQARLNHANVVNVHNLLELNGRLLLVMEFVEGQTLNKLVQDQGALPVQEAVKIARKVLEALEFMHTKGVVHRDLKPSNIMITPDNGVKVTDFGIAKAATEKGQTRTGVRLGTLWYMSPEQIKGLNVDARSDLYAFGVTLFQMVTGKIPFFGSSDFEVMKGHMETQPPRPTNIKKDIPKPLSDIILKLLEKKPEKRYQSAADVLNALAEVKEAPRKIASGASKNKAIPGSEKVKALVAARTANKPGQMFWIILASALAAVVIAIVGYYWYSSRKSVVIPVVKSLPAKRNQGNMTQNRPSPPNPKAASEKDVTPIIEEFVKKKSPEKTSPEITGAESVQPEKKKEKRLEGPKEQPVLPSSEKTATPPAEKKYPWTRAESQPPSSNAQIKEKQPNRQKIASKQENPERDKTSLQSPAQTRPVKRQPAQKGWIGIYTREITPEIARNFGLKTYKNGLLVTKVYPKSPAAKAGIKRGDVILAFGGKPANSTREMARIASQLRVGQKVSVKIARVSKTMTFYITVGSRRQGPKIKRSASKSTGKTGSPRGNATIADRWGGFVKSLKKSVKDLEKGKTSRSSSTETWDNGENDPGDSTRN